MPDKIKFYFSFRSPYSWLAFYRLCKIADQLPVEIEYTPCFPPEEFANDPRKNKNKSLYIAGDIKRFADAYGLKSYWPKPFDTDWIIPHSAYIYAQDNDKDITFALNAYSLRFEEGKNIGDDQLLSNIAGLSGLDPINTVQAAHDKQFQDRVISGMKATVRDRMFGVPFFIYNNQKYWGNDRLEWLLRDLTRESGEAVPDLVKDPFSRPF